MGSVPASSMRPSVRHRSQVGATDDSDWRIEREEGRRAAQNNAGCVYLHGPGLRGRECEVLVRNKGMFTGWCTCETKNNNRRVYLHLIDS